MSVPISVSSIVNKLWGAGTRTLTALPTVLATSSVQFGTIVMSGTTTTTTITAVAPTKAVLFHLGVDGGSGNLDSSTFIRMTLTNSTTITAVRVGTTRAATVSFCVVEFA